MFNPRAGKVYAIAILSYSYSMCPVLLAQCLASKQPLTDHCTAHYTVILGLPGARRRAAERSNKVQGLRHMPSTEAAKLEQQGMAMLCTVHLLATHARCRRLS
jgi:hypothetical protein